MRPQDLRIGNLINGIYYEYENEEESEEIENEIVCKVAALDVADMCEYRIYVETEECDIEIFSDFQGIPLTEEWLTKLGFKQQGQRKMWIKDRVCVVLESYTDLSGKPTPEAFYIGFKDLGNVLFHTTLKVECVHELQNAFALTGEELTFQSK